MGLLCIRMKKSEHLDFGVPMVEGAPDEPGSVLLWPTQPSLR